jgi:hypothetical protein
LEVDDETSPWKRSATTMSGIDFLSGRKGSGPISENPMMMRKQPVVVTPFGIFLSQMMPQMGAELPVVKVLMFYH